MANVIYGDHHLTKTGWVKGTERLDDGTLTNVTPPTDTVLTVRYTRSKSGREYVSTQWKTDKKDKLDQLVQQYGDTPQELAGKVRSH